MQLSDLAFDLPTELIAQQPVEPRDAARMLVYNRADRSIAHHYVRDLPNLLPSHTVLVANESRVRNSRLQAVRSNGKTCELLVLEPSEGTTFECMIRGKHITLGESLTLEDDSIVTIVTPHQEAAFTTYLVDFHRSHTEAETLIHQLGTTPLPPYITDSTAPAERYQTVFAETLGSAAAPTAGLHFTPELIATLKDQGHTWETVTLHVGMGTFQPLRDPEITNNTLHHEWTRVTEATADRINKGREASKPILSIGTTTCRTLESHARNGAVVPGTTSTDLFIYPGYTFSVTNLLLTNFHLPQSSLLLLVAALVGADPTGTPNLTPTQAIAEVQRIYKQAIANQYRFFSFGDCMLVL
jgi:S-adenosylmethionine:tRNA ribosyltransferase-isomerase